MVTTITDWMVKNWEVITVSCGITLIAIVLVSFFLIIKLPADYFSEDRVSYIADKHPIMRIFLQVIKTLVGFLFLIFGLIMIIAPGPATLTILIGIILLDFPNKRKLERRIISQPKILNAINYIRCKWGHQALELLPNSPKSGGEEKNLY